MNLKFNLGIVLALLILMGCGEVRKAKGRGETEATKTLVLYYSQTGATKQIAQELQRQLGADIDSIVAVESYGMDYEATVERWRREREDSVKVAIKPLARNVNDYDTIFLGFPVWGGCYASPVATWLADNKVEGKTIITFATFGSGGIEPATLAVAAQEPSSTVIEGYGVRNARISKAPAEIERYLIENGYKGGNITTLPEYGEETRVEEEDVEIFNKACSDYKFPLGTPVTVAKRSYDNTTDYRFKVKALTPDGQEVNSIIYVTVPPDEKPAFTRVVR